MKENIFDILRTYEKKGTHDQLIQEYITNILLLFSF